MEQGCKDCPLSGRPKVPPMRAPVRGKKLDTFSTPVLLGEAPGRQEVKLGKPFVGKSGQLLAAVLADRSVDDQHLHITNACLCHPLHNETPTEEMIDACRPRLLAELKETGTSKVLMLGNTAIQALIPGAPGVTKIRGVPQWHEELECYVIPTFHPAAILRNPDMMRDLVDDVDTFQKLPEGEMIHEPPEDLFYNVVETSGGMIKLVEAIHEAEIVSCDLETTGVDRMNDEIISIGFATTAEDLWIIPDTTFKKRWAHDILEQVFELTSVFWVTQNGPQFDAQFIFREFGVEWKIDFDTLLGHYTVDERQRTHGLKVLVGRYFMAPNYGIDMNAFLAQDREEWDLDELYWYQALDCHYTWRLYWDIYEQIEGTPLERVHDEILLPASHALAIVERTGVLIDRNHFERLDKDLEVELEGLLANVRETSEKEDFNANSPKQVKELLIEKLHILPAGSSTGQEILEGIEKKHPVVGAILDYRRKSKLRSTYVKGFLNSIDEGDRLHADFLLFGTETGRLSARNPNLQNIPIYRGPEIRRGIIAAEGWTFAEADYSQLELRVAAYYSRDPFLLKAYHEGIDIHTLTASEVYEVPFEEVTYDQRYIVKRVTFGIIYGRGARSLAIGELHCSTAQAQKYIDKYLERFSKFHDWIKEQHRVSVENGYVETPVGRRRRFALITNDNVAEIERQSANTPIQSLASDICLTALTRLLGILDPTEAKVVSTVHDSILLEIRDDVLEKCLRQVTSEMERCPILPEFLDVLPLKTDVKIGQNWGDAEEIEIDEYFRKQAKKQSKARRRSGKTSH